MSQAQYRFPEEETLDPAAIAALQRRKLAAMLAEILPANSFYRNKFSSLRFNPMTDPLDRLPFTTRQELEADQAANIPYGTNLTYPLDRYVRLHQTSGTGGRPMRWLDTVESWNWFKRCWSIIFAAAGVSKADRIFFPFSFGPFVGFWAAFEGSVAQGNLSLPAGGMTTTARIRMMLDNQATVVCCTPTYALRLAEIAEDEGIDLAGSPVHSLIVAGEPGGSVPGVRRRIESAWGARLFDHTGMTEIGSLGFECREAPAGVHLIESECIPEIIDSTTGKVLPIGETGELVLTNLGRWGSPLIRYRTGDQARLTRVRCACGRCFARMEGGILGRIDDMIVVRGNNIFPTAVEAIVREFAGVCEYRLTVDSSGALAEAKLEIELSPSAVDSTEMVHRLEHTIQDRLSLRAKVQIVAAGALPRFEMKARRFVRTGAVKN